MARIRLILIFLCLTLCFGARAESPKELKNKSNSACSPVFARLALTKSATPNIQDYIGFDKTFRFSVKTLSGEKINKFVRFLPEDSWGAPKEFIGKVYNLTMTVQNLDEAYQIFNSLIRNGPPEWRALKIPPLEPGKVSFEIPGRLWPYVHSTADAHEVRDRPFEFNIIFPTNSDGPKEAQNLLQSLLNHGLTYDPKALQTMDLSTVGAKREWARYSFYSWAQALSREQANALYKLGGADYRAINAYLRSPKKAIDSQIESIIENADSAISKGVVNRTITTYRYDASPELESLFDKLTDPKNSTNIPKTLKADPAYKFTTIDPKVADWWNFSTLKRKGLLLEIEVPAGSPAAFLDLPGIYDDRGYLELLLPRSAKLVITGHGFREDGQKVLQVKFEKNAP